MVVLSHSKNIGRNSLGAVKTNIQVCWFGPHLIVSFLHSIGILLPNSAIDSHCTDETPNHAEIGYIGTTSVLPPMSSCSYSLWSWRISTTSVLLPKSSCSYRRWSCTGQRAKLFRACEMLIPMLSSMDDEWVLNHCRAITLPSWLLPPALTSYLYLDHFLTSSCSSAVFCAQISRHVKDGIQRTLVDTPTGTFSPWLCTGKLRDRDLEAGV